MLTCVRPDGSITTSDMARQAILPRDACQFVVETTLAWHDAFFGRVARGSTLSETALLVQGQNRTWSQMVQALQAQALVECFQAEQCGGLSDPAEFAVKLIQETRRRGVAPPDITTEELEQVRVSLREFGAAWRPLQSGQSLERTFGT